MNSILFRIFMKQYLKSKGFRLYFEPNLFRFFNKQVFENQKNLLIKYFTDNKHSITKTGVKAF
ncbi:hypothetical protein LEP1GSC059_3118 [Leptospira noguchii serovar Panama str. CZ214]|uniref:Uncharacterized protein n=1 Tax=Leptospira noguchii serovar Panama str. CZ214 TaxID=1001595 RepID=T0GQ63_9LEPT|nr:hypothetical protein LEP1GSC059_3118 [Leptospira noguchii serovar Panama str. CZ214]